MKALLTGITGFAGSHLADYILAHHPAVELHGTRGWRSKEDAANDLNGKVTFHECDITDSHNVYRVIEKVKLDKIFHLAAKFRAVTGWRPTIPFEKTVEESLA